MASWCYPALETEQNPYFQTDGRTSGVYAAEGGGGGGLSFP